MFIAFLFSACHTNTPNNVVFKTSFSLEEQKILRIADSIINSAYYASLITLDANYQPRARIVEPFSPEKNYVIWMATNPKSRKVTQLKNNSSTTLHYFDKNKLAYVSLMGNAFLVNDIASKNRFWKDGWENFYPNKDKDYLLIKFVPKSLELISISDGFTGDNTTWKPHLVTLVE